MPSLLVGTRSTNDASHSALRTATTNTLTPQASPGVIMVSGGLAVCCQDLTALLSIGPKPVPAQLRTHRQIKMVGLLLGGVTREVIIMTIAFETPSTMPAMN